MGFLLQLGYNLLFLVGFLLLWPYFTYRLWRRGRLRKDFGQRLGWYSREVRQKLRHGHDIWIHAVSVGEVMLASVLLYHLRQHQSKLRVVISTTTATGFRVAQKMENDNTTIIYNPMDFLWGVRSAFRAIRPKLLILIEAEIWPNYLWLARRRKIPVFLVNTRLSPQTEQRYQQFRWFCRPVLRLLHLVFAQHDSDIERLVGAGFPAEKIFPVGSLKYDVADLPEQNGREISAWWRHSGWAEDDLILLGGSTHHGEEEVLARIYERLRHDYPKLRLVIAPRHAERGPHVQEVCETLGLRAILRSDLQTPLHQGSVPHVLVLNSTGELRSIYGLAHVVFMGKSLRAKGGQNFIEAARVGAPIIVGPNMQNFAHLSVEFLERGGLIQVLDEFELAQRIRELVATEAKRAEIGARAQAIFAGNLGAGKRTAEIILNYLSVHA